MGKEKESIIKAGRQVSELKKRLNGDLTKARRSKKIILIIACILLPVMIGYMSWIHVRVKKLAQPETIASILRYHAELEILKTTRNISAGLIAAAPNTAEELSQQCLRKIPILRKQLELLVVECVEQLLEGSEKKIDSVMSELLASGSGNQYRDILDILNDDKAMEVFWRDFYQEILNEVDEKLQKKADLELSEVLDISSNTFSGILNRLDLLKSKKEDELTGYEALQKRFVIVLMELVRKH